MKLPSLATVSLGPRGRPLRRAGMAAAVLVLTACAAGQGRNPFDSSLEGQASIFIQIENRGFNDIRVHAITPGGSRSMGSVTGNTIHRTTLEWRQLAQISFRLEVLAGRTYMTHALAASPGDRLELIIPSDPGNAVLRFRDVRR